MTEPKFKVLSDEEIEAATSLWRVGELTVREAERNVAQAQLKDTLRQVVEMLEGIENPFPLIRAVTNEWGEYHHTENDSTHIGFDEAIQTIRQSLQQAGKPKDYIPVYSTEVEKELDEYKP